MAASSCPTASPGRGEELAGVQCPLVTDLDLWAKFFAITPPGLSLPADAEFLVWVQSWPLGWADAR